MGWTKRVGGGAGYSLVELLATMSIFGVVALAGLPHVDNRREDINSSIQRVLSDMRYARSRAITSGEHFAVEWKSASSYEVQRMIEVGGEWQVDSVVRDVDLPSHILLLGATGPGIERFEFNTRGMMISSNDALWPVMLDTIHGSAHLLSIWPSGQVYREGSLTS